MDILRKDFLYAVRSLLRQPGFTLVTMLTLALGHRRQHRGLQRRQRRAAAAAAAIRTPSGWSSSRASSRRSASTSSGSRCRSSSSSATTTRSFASVGALQRRRRRTSAPTPPSRPVRALVTPELMPTLGVQPLRGRVVHRGRLARRTRRRSPSCRGSSGSASYGGDRGVARPERADQQQSNEIVGIMPRGYDVHDQKVELWQPLTIDPATFAEHARQPLPVSRRPAARTA